MSMIKEIPECSVFVIWVYSGASKPTNMQEYLQEFIVDMKAISLSGIVYNGVHFRVALSIPFIFDALAHGFLKFSKGYTGSYGCERCTQKGQQQNGKVVYLEISADEQFGRQDY